MRILLLGPLASSFVRTDITELARVNTVVGVDTILGKGARGAVALLGLTIRSVVKLFTADVLYCWFADYHTLVPTVFARLMGKRVIIIAGGFDVGYLPNINYGARSRTIRWFCVRKTFQYASTILPVSSYASRQLSMLTNGNHAPATVVYNGVITDGFPNEANVPTEKEPIALTVSQGSSRTEYVRKGIDRFIEVAKQTPEIHFHLVGPQGEALQLAQKHGADVANLTITPGFVSLHRVVVPLMKRASCYCQFSIEETFGMAVAEAMLCGCIAVTTNGGALPEVTSDAGLRGETIAELSELVQRTLHASSEQRKASHRQAMNFTAERRGETLRELLR